jgi:hypothetical protein
MVGKIQTKQKNVFPTKDSLGKTASSAWPTGRRTEASEPIAPMLDSHQTRKVIWCLERTNVDIIFIRGQTHAAQSKVVSAWGPKTLLRHFHFLPTAPTSSSPERKRVVVSAPGACN